MIRKGSCGRRYRHPILVRRRKGRLNSTLVGLSCSSNSYVFHVDLRRARRRRWHSCNTESRGLRHNIYELGMVDKMAYFLNTFGDGWESQTLFIQLPYVTLPPPWRPRSRSALPRRWRCHSTCH